MSQTSLVDTAKRSRVTNGLSIGVLALLAAVVVAALISVANDLLVVEPDASVKVVGVLLATVLALPAIWYVLRRRTSSQPFELALVMLATVGVVLVGIYLYWISSYIVFPADFLIWSEGEFVNDILKFRMGYPIYSAQENNESFIYTPGTQLLTYMLAWLVGRPTSISVYRVIQVGYTLVAAVVAYACCHRIRTMVSPERPSGGEMLWGALWLPVLFLVATNALTNPFAQLLHNDALAQLVSVTAFWVLLHYASTRDARMLALMAVLPMLGFWVKQSLVVWAGLYGVYLVLFDRPRSIHRVAIFAGATATAVALSLIVGYLIWDNHFFYWVFGVTGGHGTSVLRSFQHLLDVWVYVALCLCGGWVLLRGDEHRRLLGPWVITLGLILVQVYTSGIAWMLNHIGPGSLLAGIWFLVALTRIWPSLARASSGASSAQSWLYAGIAVVLVCLLFGGMSLVRIPLDPIPEDAYRYVREIESEFEGLPSEDVLLDSGTWVYFEDGVIIKDRVASIGDRGFGGTGDFGGILDRLARKRYSKILVRNLHSPDFHYDWWMWSESSGIRQAMLDNYREVGRIAAVDGESYQHGGYFFDEISILVPSGDGGS